MGRIGTFISGMVVGAAIYFVANHYHIVRSDEGVFAIAKVNQNLDDIYVDIRGFGLSDWQQHRMLAASLLKSDRAHLLEDSALSGFRKSMQSVLNGLLGDA